MRLGKLILGVALAGLIGGASLITAVSAQDAAGGINQFVVTEEQVQGLIAAQADLAAIAKKLENAPEGEDLKVEEQLDAIATKHGFKSFAELDDVSANVQLVLDGLDPETGEYTDPVEGLKQELEDVKADNQMAAEEKKALLEELEEALAAIPPLQNKENIDVVKKHRDAIQAALDAGDAAN